MSYQKGEGKKGKDSGANSIKLRITALMKNTGR